MSHPPKTAGHEGEFDFAPFNLHPFQTGRSVDIVRFLTAKWKSLVLGLGLGLAAGIGLYLVLGPVYSASTQVLVSKKATVPIHDGEANRYGDRGDHVQLLKTDLIVERAYKDHGLDAIPQLVNAYDPLKEITEGLSVSRSAGQESSFDNILAIAYLHPDKEIARKVVQAIVNSYHDYLDETRDLNARQLYRTLLNRQQQLDEEVRRLESEYQTFRREAPVFLKASPVVTVNGMPAAAQTQYEAELASIEQAQNENLRKRSSIQARLATLERKIKENTPREVLEFFVMHSLSTGTSGGGGGAGGGGGGATLTASPEKAALDQQLLTARLLEQRLLHTLGDDHSSVRNVRRQIDTILDFYSRQGLTPPREAGQDGPRTSRSAALGMDLVSVYTDILQGQLKELDIDDNNLALLHEDAQKKAKQAEMFEVEDQRRKDDIGLKKTQLEAIYNQIAAYDVSREQEGYRLQQISQVRIERSLKRVLKLVGTCGVLGMAIVFCLAYFREWYDKTLKSLDEVRRESAQPLIGAVPEFHISAAAERLANERGLASSLCFFHRPGSREAEAYRSIRTTLFIAMQNNEQVIQFSSAEPGDGKSTTAANLAIAIAQSGKRVLLIDGDLRRPTQHALFRTPQDVGLSDVLLGEIAWENAVRTTQIENLSLLTSGLCPENPAELLSRQQFPDLLKAARKEYDYILLDSPPVLAVSDPSIMTPYIDGMLAVVRMQKTKQAAVRQLRETLHSHGVRVLGTIANDLNAQQAGEAGYDYESYGAYYGKSTEASSAATASTPATGDTPQPAAAKPVLSGPLGRR